MEPTRAKELAAAGTTCVPLLPARTISSLQSLVVARDKRGRKWEWHVWLVSCSRHEGASWSGKLACSLCVCGWFGLFSPQASKHKAAMYEFPTYSSVDCALHACCHSSQKCDFISHPCWLPESWGLLWDGKLGLSREQTWWVNVALADWMEIHPEIYFFFFLRDIFIKAGDRELGYFFKRSSYFF